MAGIGAFYLLMAKDEAYAKTFVRTGVTIGIIAACLQLFPSGDAQGKLVSKHQPTTLAAMEGLFQSEEGAPLAILGQPNVQARKLENPFEIPRMLSFLTYQRWSATVRGLDQFSKESWPDRIPLVYYSYHVMVGLGTLFIAVMAASAFLLWRRKLFSANWMLWILMINTPFPYIANTAGWLTAELGRQPWLVYGLLRTSQGASASVEAGSTWFTLLGFMGMYALLSILFLFLVWRQIELGPEAQLPVAEEATTALVVK